MARAPSKRVVMNREALDAITLGCADAFQRLAESVLEVARPNVPDAPPLGKGLVASGKAATYVDGKKVAGQGTAPRGTVAKSGVSTVVGYDFPGRFLETGTVKMEARPFLTPALSQAAPEGDEYVVQGVKQRLAGVHRNATNG